MELRPSRLRAMVCGLLVACTGGCLPSNSTTGDKVGGANTPLELRLALAETPPALAAEDFARRVDATSHGRLHLRITYLAFGSATPDVEIRLVRAVQKGKYDLGWVATRVWDEIGVQSMTPLQAPFVITDYGLLGRVLQDPIAGQMLAGLKAADVTGLALIPSRLRYPVGVHGYLRSVADWHGANIRVQPSRTSDAVVRALGASPVHVSNDDIFRAMTSGAVTGYDTGLPPLQPGYLTANVVLFPRVDTIFANPQVLNRLNSAERAALGQAAHAEVAQTVSHPPDVALLLAQFCTGGGHVATATAEQLAGLRAATGPIVAALQRDHVTAPIVARILSLKAEVPSSTPPTDPTCPTASPSLDAATSSIPPSTLNGTYRYVLTQAGADQWGPPATDPGNIYPQLVTVELRNGMWRAIGGDPRDFGTYIATRDRIVFSWPHVNTVITMTYRRDADGTLHMTPVLPMDVGDQFVWSGAPWQRIGPPVGPPK